MTKVRRITKQDASDWEVAKARSQSGQPPSPFTSAPKRLNTFLDTLDPSKVYIVHIDHTPAVFKRRIFYVPVALNLAIACLLLWRAVVIVPVYLELLNAVLGYRSQQAVDTATKTSRQLAYIVARRAIMFMIDFCLVRFIVPWPVSFFLESPANPVSWRWKVGYLDREVVVRESRAWGSNDLLQGVKAGQDSPFWKTRVLPAIDARLIREKTGYMMMDKSWDLDFRAMIDAHTLLDRKELTYSDFELAVLAHDEKAGWLIYEAHKIQAQTAEAESRQKIVNLKNRLTMMGKESLFFRWIEIVQYESSQPGGFDDARQKHTYAQLQTLFGENGIDFAKFVDDIGGLQGTPGMEVHT